MADILGNSSWSNLCLSRECREAKKMEAESELIKAEALLEMSRQPAQRTSPLVYLIPVAGILVIGAIVIIAKKRR